MAQCDRHWPSHDVSIYGNLALLRFETLACTLFAGASVYINLVEHPARLSCGTEIAPTQWAPSYKRATVMQVSLAVIATSAGLIRGVARDGAIWLLAAALIFVVIPFAV